MIFGAIKLAKEAHKGQTRRFSGEPYIIHPARVATQVALLPDADEEMVAAAWLHDVLEDTQTTIEEMYLVVGKEVTDLVRELTFNPNNFTGHYQQIKRIQNQHIAAASRRAKTIKILDRLDNLEDFERAYGNAVLNDGAANPSDFTLRRLEKFERYVKTSWELYKLLTAQNITHQDYLNLLAKFAAALLRYDRNYRLNITIS